MFLTKFKKTWTGLNLENQFRGWVAIGLIVSNILLAMKVVMTQPIIVDTPPTLDKASEIKAGGADENYKKAWALFLADLMGAITPSNVDFIVQSLSLYLSSNVYNSVKDGLYDQAREIRDEGMTITFSPKEVTFEQASGKVFVYGNNRTERRDGKAENIDRTYEFIVSIQNYRPIITRMSVYRGPPLTIEKVKAMQLKGKSPDAATDNSDNPTAVVNYEENNAAPAAPSTQPTQGGKDGHN